MYISLAVLFIIMTGRSTLNHSTIWKEHGVPILLTGLQIIIICKWQSLICNLLVLALKQYLDAFTVHWDSPSFSPAVSYLFAAHQKAVQTLVIHAVHASEKDIAQQKICCSHFFLQSDDDNKSISYPAQDDVFKTTIK